MSSHFLGKIKKQLLNLFERTSPFCKLKLFWKSSANSLSQFPIKDVRPKKLSAGIITAMLVITAKGNVIFTSVQPNTRDFHISETHFINKRVNDVKQPVISRLFLPCERNQKALPRYEILCINVINTLE